MPSRRLAGLVRNRTLTVAATLCALLLGQVARAAELTDLFQAKVPAGLSQSQWQRQALQDVLLKLTGSEAVLSQPGLAESLKNSGQYVVQFQQIVHEGQPQLLVTLDGQKLTQLLQSQQIPVWGARRPDVLLWLTERPVETPQFVLSPEHPLRKALMQQATRYGLSLQFPLFDETDTSLVNETASWGGDWGLIQQASARYQATEVHNLLFDQQTDASGLVQFRLTWQQQVDGALQSKELMNADAMVLAQQFCAELAAAQAARYAVRISVGADQTAGELQLTFDGINSLTDLHALRQLFSGMLTVRDHRLVSYSAGQAILQLQLSASTDEFYRALSLIRELTPQAEPVTAQSTDPAGLPVTQTEMAPASALGDGAAALEVSSGVTSEVTDAEAAMEAALAGDHTLTTIAPEAVSNAAATPTATEPAANNAIVISSRYLFRRQ